MKKSILFLALLLSAAALQAQFGVKGGIAISNWGGEDVDDISDVKSSIVGPYFGAFYNAKIGGMFSIQPELVYSSQGVQFEESGFELKYTLGYLNFTPVARWNSASGFYLGTGPQIGFLLSAKEKFDGDEEDVKDNFRSTDFSWIFAAGYDLKSGLGFYARYNHGLSTLDDEETDPAKVYNRVFNVGIRYTVGPSKKSKDSAKK